MNRYIIGDLFEHTDQKIYDHYVSYGSKWARYYRENWTKAFEGGRRKVFVYGGSTSTTMGDLHNRGGTKWHMLYLGEYLCWREMMMDLRDRCISGKLDSTIGTIMDIGRRFCWGMYWESYSLKRHFRNLVDGDGSGSFVLICHRKDPFIDMMMLHYMRNTILYRFDYVLDENAIELPEGFEHLKMREWWEK
jgi:hypothetical protein